MMNEIKIFESPEFGRIRTVNDEKGEPWFIGKDVATVLGYSNVRDAFTSMWTRMIRVSRIATPLVDDRRQPSFQREC